MLLAHKSIFAFLDPLFMCRWILQMVHLIQVGQSSLNWPCTDAPVKGPPHMMTDLAEGIRWAICRIHQQIKRGLREAQCFDGPITSLIDTIFDDFALPPPYKSVNLGCNSIDILDSVNLSLNPRLNRCPIRRLPKLVLNPCLKLRLDSSLKFQMSIELHPRSCARARPTSRRCWPAAGSSKRAAATRPYDWGEFKPGGIFH